MRAGQKETPRWCWDQALVGGQPAHGSVTGSGNVQTGIVGVLIGLRGDVADRGMDPRVVVEGLDVVENTLAGLGSGDETLTVDKLDLESPPEALRAGVIMAVAASAHADGDTRLDESLPIIAASVLATPIAVVNQASGWPTIGQGHVERSGDQ